MAEPLKVISTEITLSTANDVSQASLVRVVNVDGTNNVVITHKNANGGTTYGSFTLGNATTDFSSEYVVKQPTDTLTVTGTATIKAVSVAYR